MAQIIVGIAMRRTLIIRQGSKTENYTIEMPAGIQIPCRDRQESQFYLVSACQPPPRAWNNPTRALSCKSLLSR